MNVRGKKEGLLIIAEDSEYTSWDSGDNGQ